ncbi:MAG: class I SAM-dependent methyltransferase [Planctomycetota bacterium]|nr:class I SAM-dependent methyltransferase [Planctomycetota bacterium]MDA1249523.1 class I SAM-dependent methyltransferase [Planctomycetota bacterium]
MRVLHHLRTALDTAIYGPIYGVMNSLIRNPLPHDPEMLWQGINQELPAVVNWLNAHYPPYFARKLLLSRKLRQEHHEGIEEHYDVSNEFYRLFLDERYMFYTCADFRTPQDTLEEAQTNKANFLLNLIDPRPGEKILDLGCGWGGMLRRIEEAVGSKEHLKGYTLSRRQLDHIQSNFGFDVELENFVTCDYPAAGYDKIYSIGSWEHVRHRDVAGLLRKLFDALKPGGRLVHHFFCPLVETVPTWILTTQLFFPGSFPPAYPTQVRLFEKAGFRISHQSIHDYRPTLRAWFDRLVANRERAIELVGLQTYNKYLVFFAMSWRFFDESYAMLVRYVLEKPR